MDLSSGPDSPALQRGGAENERTSRLSCTRTPSCRVYFFNQL